MFSLDRFHCIWSNLFVGPGWVLVYIFALLPNNSKINCKCFIGWKMILKNHAIYIIILGGIYTYILNKNNHINIVHFRLTVENDNKLVICHNILKSKEKLSTLTLSLFNRTIALWKSFLSWSDKVLYSFRTLNCPSCGK